MLSVTTAKDGMASRACASAVVAVTATSISATVVIATPVIIVPDLLTNVPVLPALVAANFATLFPRQGTVGPIPRSFSPNLLLALAYGKSLSTGDSTSTDAALDLTTILSIVIASRAIAILRESIGRSRQ